MPMELDLQQKEAWIRSMTNFVTYANWGGRLILPPKSMDLVKPLYKWLKKEVDFPTQTNCMEALLFSGADAGLWTRSYVAESVKTSKSEVNGEIAGVTKLSKFIFRRGIYAGKMADIPSGNILMFGDWGDHFVLTTGNGNVLELDSKDKGPNTIDGVRQRYTHKPAFVSPPPTLEELKSIV